MCREVRWCAGPSPTGSKKEGEAVPSLGQRLRREREQRGISLDEISLSTKIGTRFLLALEEDKFDKLPGCVFNKGFISKREASIASYAL